MDDTGGITAAMVERFWRHVAKADGDACWEWQGWLSKRGYGQFGFTESRRHAAPRASWLIHFGPIPDGLEVCHDCPGGDNPRCVRPDHLWLGTRLDNERDKTAKGRRPVGARIAPKNPARGERSGAYTHPERVMRGDTHACSRLTSAQVREIRRRYASGGITQKELSQHYGVVPTQISSIVRRVTWRSI